MDEPTITKRRRSCSNGEIMKNNEKNIEISRKIRLKDADFSLLTIENFEKLETYDYKIPQLKMMLKKYKQRVSGTKREMHERIYNYLRKSFFARKIQTCFRRHVVKLWTKFKGRGLLKRSLCTNDTDFFSLEPINELAIEQYISFNEKGFVYGFDICSVCELFKNSKSYKIENPFTRSMLSENVYFQLKRSIQLQKCLQMHTIEEIQKDEIQDIYSDANIHHRLVDIFSRIDGLGNYSDVNWFLSLNKRGLLRYIRELHDIWNYRAQLTPEVKINICYPTGNPFSINVNYLTDAETKNYVQYYTLDIIHNFISKGRTEDDKSLGAVYVLSALTLVNNQAAQALPWLYESVCHMAHI